MPKSARRVGFALWFAGASLALTSALPAQQMAKGKFNGSSWSFEVATAYAFPSKMLLDDGKGIVVALTNDDVDQDWLSAWVDRRWVLDNMVANQNQDDRVLVAYLGFHPDGKLEGLSWYFASGDGCGFCSSGKIQSTVKVLKGRLKGTIKGEEDDYSLDVEIDVPLQHEVPGVRLPTGGDAPAAAYLALRDVLYSDNRAPAWEMLDFEWKEILKDRTPEGREEFFAALVSEKVSKEPRIVGGYTEGDRAVLLFEAEESYGKVRGEVRMDREAGVWKYDDSWRTIKFD